MVAGFILLLPFRACCEGRTMISCCTRMRDFIDRIKIRAEALLPGQLELPVVIGTVSQIEVNQGLIGDTFGVGQRLEVVDGAAVDVDGDLLFQPVRVWIFSWIQFADVIFISHTITSNSIKINALLGFGCLPCRDNTDAVFVVAVAMAHNANFLRFD